MPLLYVMMIFQDEVSLVELALICGDSSQGREAACVLVQVERAAEDNLPA